MMPKPSETRTPSNPWPQWPRVLKTDYGQEEAIALMGGEIRSWSCDTVRIETDEQGRVSGVTVADLSWDAGAPTRVAGSERTLPAQLVLIACGFTGAERAVYEAFGCSFPAPGAGRPLPRTQAGTHRCETAGDEEAPQPPVFACGDGKTGSSLVVSAIADALACADEVARALDR